MESWRKQDLDKMTSGEVALELFEAEQNLCEASDKRAETACRVVAIQRELERAQEEYNDAAQDEKYCYNEHKQLKTYLAERLHKTI